MFLKHSKLLDRQLQCPCGRALCQRSQENLKLKRCVLHLPCSFGFKVTREQNQNDKQWRRHRWRRIHRAMFMKQSDSASTLDSEWLFPGYQRSLKARTRHNFSQWAEQWDWLYHWLTHGLTESLTGRLTERELAWLSVLGRTPHPACWARACRLRPEWAAPEFSPACGDIIGSCDHRRAGTQLEDDEPEPRVWWATCEASAPRQQDQAECRCRSQNQPPPGTCSTGRH